MTELAEELKAWFDRWAECVRACDFDAARTLFSPDVVGFGTRMHVVRGLDRLEQHQWRHVWPTIEGFSFVLDELHVSGSNDGSQAFGVVPWVSTGFAEDGAPFDRPGRATVIFARGGDPARTPGGWLAEHTHISLAPGTPQRSFGRSADQR
jgi:ketosteroid isomerase-like protein